MLKHGDGLCIVLVVPIPAPEPGFDIKTVGHSWRIGRSTSRVIPRRRRETVKADLVYACHRLWPFSGGTRVANLCRRSYNGQKDIWTRLVIGNAILVGTDRHLQR